MFWWLLLSQTYHCGILKRRKIRASYSNIFILHMSQYKCWKERCSRLRKNQHINLRSRNFYFYIFVLTLLLLWYYFSGYCWKKCSKWYLQIKFITQWKALIEKKKNIFLYHVGLLRYNSTQMQSELVSNKKLKVRGFVPFYTLNIGNDSTSTLLFSYKNTTFVSFYEERLKGTVRSFCTFFGALNKIEFSFFFSLNIHIIRKHIKFPIQWCIIIIFLFLMQE